ncbi:MAG TPA: hypothetical protein VMY76_01045 [Gemmatimonadales bacterium]|nr:hypothetical protein [Gemmatimonadales bacterium]
MAQSAPISPSIRARIIHGALVLGIVLFWALAYAVSERSVPAEALPDRRVLYIALALVSATLFGAAAFTAGRLAPPGRGASEDDWWQLNLGRVLMAWALVEAPTLLGLVAYTLTRDFRTLLAPFIGLLLFANYHPRRLTER